MATKKNYWNDKQEQLIRKYLSRYTEENEKNIIYLKIEPALKILINAVLYKFYSDFYFSENRGIIVNSCLVYVMLKLNKVRVKKGTAFTFLTTVIKNHLYNELIHSAKWKKNQMSRNLFYVDNVLELEYMEENNQEFTIEKN